MDVNLVFKKDLIIKLLEFKNKVLLIDKIKI